jgi:GNAT superfamily N-acetyltransferase
MGKTGKVGAATQRAGERASRPSGGAASGVATTAAEGITSPSRATIKFDPDLTLGERKAQLKAIRDLVGRKITGRQVASMFGAPDGAKVQILDVERGSIGFVVRFREGEAYRSLRRDASGKPYIYNDEITLKPEFRGSGLGPRIFAKQVHFAEKFGITQIKTDAVRADGKYYGYNVWPKLGYEGPLTATQAASVPKGLGNVTHVSQLMATTEGRAWWREHGQSIKVTFDLTPGSYSRKALDNYLKEKGRK